MWWPFKERYSECHPKDTDSKTYDYVVIGGGTAGCALASRLSENADISVLVLEYGPANDTWLSRNPVISSDPTVPTFGSTRWQCETMEHCDNRRSGVIRGEVLGGTSRINSMIYTRGCAADYDAWAALGHHEWSYDKVLPYFVKSETSLDYGKSSYHGNSVSPTALRLWGSYLFQTQMHRTLPQTDWQLCHLLSTNNESEYPAFRHFCHERLLWKEKNLTICTNTTIARIGFEQGHGKPCTDKIFFKSSDPALEKVYAAKVNKEVIVCAGAIGSLQVLMLSGIGPGEELKKHGIDVVYDLPGVGAELTEHLSVPVAWETLALYVRSRLLNTEHTGIISTNKDSSDPLDFIPDIELIPLSTSAMDNFDESEFKLIFSKTPIYSVLATMLQPQSRGTVRLTSSSPHDKPQVDYGILSNPADYTVARSARLDVQSNSTEELDKFIRKRIRTTFHYASTCRMVPEHDATGKAPGVVDDELRVYGVKGLRVCDTSVFPRMVSGHLQAPAVMVAEKCADLIKAGHQ
ncbi:hypothetical protein SBOR_9715 [Sclerotinia borealis F-4128]|uniref:Glucose-methanol-choline oxidoreductase N-terminal domain-containing protein n=1 Tax=Sclerotinia borealis (strain F-4128) TaxID=1432307 RepID=W9C2I7_SCLBF|nr:hypothetical protein SBOR_9715 [Sclerotinia borealis F-4128]